MGQPLPESFQLTVGEMRTRLLIKEFSPDSSKSLITIELESSPFLDAKRNIFITRLFPHALVPIFLSFFLTLILLFAEGFVSTGLLESYSNIQTWSRKLKTKRKHTRPFLEKSLHLRPLLSQKMWRFFCCFIFDFLKAFCSFMAYTFLHIMGEKSLLQQINHASKY